MRSWTVGFVLGAALLLAGGSALGTKELAKDTGNKSCNTCHVGETKNKVFKDQLKPHFDCVKKKAKACRSCHEGKPKPEGKEKCR
jgi:hypothetical protein